MPPFPMPIFRKRIQTIVPLHEVANSAAVFPQLENPPSPTTSPPIATLLPMRRGASQPRTLPARKNKRLRPTTSTTNGRSLNQTVNHTVRIPLGSPMLFVTSVDSQPDMDQPSINSSTLVPPQRNSIDKPPPQSPNHLHIPTSTLHVPHPKTLTLRTRSARASSPRSRRSTEQNGNFSAPSVSPQLSEKDKPNDILRGVSKDRILKKQTNSATVVRPTLRPPSFRVDNLEVATPQTDVKAFVNTSSKLLGSSPIENAPITRQRSTSSSKAASSNPSSKRKSKSAFQPESDQVDNSVIMILRNQSIKSASGKSSDSAPDKTASSAPSQRRCSHGRTTSTSAKTANQVAESHPDVKNDIFIVLENDTTSSKASAEKPSTSDTASNTSPNALKTPAPGKTSPPTRSRSTKFSGPSPLSDAVRSSAVTRSQVPQSDREPSVDGPNASSAVILTKRKRRTAVAIVDSRSTEAKLESSRDRFPTPIDDLNDTSTKSLLKISLIAKQRKVVWTKIKGHPYWPSQFVTESEELQQQSRFQKAMHYSRRGDNQCVMYFGTCEIAFVNPEKSCIAWDDGIKKGLHNALKGRQFLDALLEVRQYCNKNPRFPKGWWNEPKCIALSSELMEYALEDDAHVKLRAYFVRSEKECIFWAKVRGFPHWPVQVLPHNMAAQNYPELKLNPGEIGNSSMPCIFFGTAEVMMVSEKALTPFGAGVCRGYVSESERQDFVVAVGEVWGYLQDPRIWPSGLLSKKKWWNLIEEKGSNGKPQSENSWLSRIPYLPRYEHIKKSVYANGVEPFPKLKGGESCCGCSPIGDEDRCLDSSCLNFASSFFCDPATCLAGKHCKNINFHKRRSPRMTPFFTSDQRGWGLKVDEPVAKGTFVVEYVGEIIDRNELERRLKSMEKVRNNEYYMMDLTNDLLVDAKFKSNLSRFINSSCEPNCKTQKWTDTSTGQTHVGIFAIQDIPAGTELTYNYCFLDYGLSGKTRKRSFSCQCGTSSCCMLDPIEQQKMKELIGKRIEVKWDDGWYAGTVEKYSLKKKRFKVQYDDGDCEDLVLGMPLADKDDEVPFRLMKEEAQDSDDGTSDSKSGRASGGK